MPAEEPRCPLPTALIEEIESAHAGACPQCRMHRDVVESQRIVVAQQRQVIDGLVKSYVRNQLVKSTLAMALVVACTACAALLARLLGAL